MFTSFHNRGATRTFMQQINLQKVSRKRMEV